MRYIKLIPHELEASSLCLGTSSFGTRITKDDAIKQMDFFFENGGNFLDTARVYGAWLPDGNGASEKTLGQWIKERECRNKVLISTKCAHPDLNNMHIPRMSKADLRSDLEESLKALGTDYIDIYFLHRDDVSKPVDEILENLEEFKKEGKIKYYGCSNWTLSRLIEAENAASHLGFTGFGCNQIRFGLADLNVNAIKDKTTVAMDSEFFTWHENTKKPAMAYTSSCNGYFSKKLAGKNVSPSIESIYNNDANQILLEKLALWEKDLGCSAAVLVSAYVMAQGFPAVSIAAFSSIAQMEEGIMAGDFVLPVQVLEEIRVIKRFVSEDRL